MGETLNMKTETLASDGMGSLTGPAAPDAIALVQGQRRLTYAQLADAANELGRQLRDDGLRAGQTVALLMPNSLESVTAICACNRLHLRVLLLDPSLKPAELATYCRHVDLSKILVSDPVQHPAGAEPGPGPSMFTVRLAPSGNPGPLDAVRLIPDTLPTPPAGYLLLSSGTTGIPKIVWRTAAQCRAALEIFANTLPLRPDDRVLGLLPFFHSFGLLYVLLSSLAAGAELHLEAFSPRATARAIARDRITVLPASPFMFRMLAETPFVQPPDTASLRLAISAGSALPRAVNDGFERQFKIGIHQSYGTTETGPAALGKPGSRVEQPGWVGKPYAGVTFEFAPAACDNTESPAGRPLAVRSPANAAGYLNDPDLTARVFRDGAVLTGDIGRQAETGDLFVLGRERPMLNVAGKKVAPAEVEACLRTHPLVTDAVVHGIAAPGGDQKIKAIVTVSAPLTDLELRQFCCERLADFKTPREIEFVDSLAVGPMGKARTTL